MKASELTSLILPENNKDKNIVILALHLTY